MKTATPKTVAAVETITPDLARTYLAANNPKNELRLQPSHVRLLGADMLAGRWRVNNDAICFSNGQLENGQHRLHAVLETGVPIRALVLRGLPTNSFEMIDTDQLGRSAYQMLKMEGTQYANQLAAAARLVQALESGDISPGKTAHRRGSKLGTKGVLQVIRDRPRLIDAVQFMCSVKSAACSPSIRSALYYLFEQIDPDLAIKFADVFDLEKTNLPVAFTKLRVKLHRQQSLPLKRRGPYNVAICIKAWNFARQHVPVSRLSFDPNIEKSPVINGLIITDEHVHI